MTAPVPSQPPAPHLPAVRPVIRERLMVPIAWWLIAFFFVLSAFAAVAFYLGPLAGVLVSGLGAAVVVAVLLSYGAPAIIVEDDALTVGPHRIEWRWVAGAVALDRAGTRRRLGPGADARAHLVTRPYLAETVEVTLADPADPHPYWLVGSRQAPAVAAAINARTRPGSTTERTDG